MQTEVRWRLSVMMFLQYMIWGAWYPVFSSYMQQLGFSGMQSGIIYSLLPVGCIVTTFAGGQLADRYFATDRLMAALHLLGGAMLCVAAPATSFRPMAVLLLIWSLLYAPTLALANSITFHHLPDAAKKFGLVRVYGTLGWIAAGFALTGLRYLWPAGLPLLGGSDALWLGGLISILLGLFSFNLPHTPPAGGGTGSSPVISALRLLRDPQFALFIAMAFVVSVQMMFYQILIAPYLQTISIPAKTIPALMTLGQMSEVAAMVALPWMLTKFGLRMTLFIGVLIWPLRFAIFVFALPAWLVVTSLMLHGVSYVFFSVVAFIYINSVATRDMRASAQAFMTFVTVGVGMLVGSLFAGWTTDHYTETVSGAQAVDYARIFFVPLILSAVCAALFVAGFREKTGQSETEDEEMAEPAAAGSSREDDSI